MTRMKWRQVLAGVIGDSDLVNTDAKGEAT